MELAPELDPVPYVFISISEAVYADLSFEAWGTIREDEGITIIAAQAQADDMGLGYQATFGRITLTVHSSLQAVGLIAAVSSRLAQAGISVNPVAGYFHDHLFVPWERRGEAMALLLEMNHPSSRQDSNNHPRL
jgi:hypothetical protein